MQTCGFSSVWSDLRICCHALQFAFSLVRLVVPGRP
uniref:Uncharacterized protein n=1 Tax=Aegilops tauschii subsp. strangulata TaxID=200361 RepID=A0A453CJ66_AEGTS